MLNKKSRYQGRKLYIMSYEIVKSLSVSESKQQIFITSDSNNVFPKSFRRWEFMEEKYYPDHQDFEYKKESLVHSFIGGSLQAKSANNYKWAYAKVKIEEYIETIDIGTMTAEHWDNKHGIVWSNWNNDECKEIRKNVTKKFFEFASEKHKDNYLLFWGSHGITKFTKNGFNYVYSRDGKEFSFKQAYTRLKSSHRELTLKLVKE
jgi:hypothetical protein